jgi:plasmid maintenance system antidote protein VapI
MDIHMNARTTRHGRLLMIERLQAGWTTPAVAKALGVTAETICRW